ncbi:MAG: hypothetical protein M3502_07400 [Actinomycetota bacterium]|nr:hypothetical protein [Actinomycetota bacterium]
MSARAVLRTGSLCPELLSPVDRAYRLGAGVDHPKVEEIWEVFAVAS